jgi:iron complex outermembrane receptor protein
MSPVVSSFDSSAAWHHLNLTSKLLYGRAFRAPSFAEQFNINNPIAIGNDNLEPEVINTYEMVFDYVPNPDFRTGVNIFYYEMEDIIRFTPVAQNTGDQNGYGLEWEFDWSVTDSFTLSGNYALQKSQDEDFDSDAPYAPEQQVFLRSDYEFNSTWSVNALLNHVMGRSRQAMDFRSEIDDYTTADVTLRGEGLVLGLDFSLSVKNLFDEEVFEPSFYREGGAAIPNDLPLAGRSIVAEIAKRW